MLDSPFAAARERLAERGLRWVAWIWDPLGDGGERLTATHLVPLPDDELVGGERLLCGRLLPMPGDVADGRYELVGLDECAGCYSAAARAGLLQSTNYG